MPGRKPKAEPMTKEQMIEAGKQKRSTSRIYKAEADGIKDEAITKSVVNALAVMKKADGGRKINLEDTEAVKRIAESYLESCAVSSAFPSMSALAMAMGYTRQSLYLFMQKKGNTPTGQFLTQLHDMFAGVLAENGLRNNANSIVSIFLLKSLFGYKDTQVIELAQGTAGNNELTIDEIEMRAGLLSDE